MDEQHNRSAELVDVLRRAILSGELKPRERLVETALAQKYQVSRTPVREAIKQLEAMGLVKLERYKGAVVSDINLNEVREMLYVRANLEGMAAALAAVSITEVELEEMRQELECMDTAVKVRDIESFSIANERFHHVTYQASGNRFLSELIQDILSKTWHERAAAWENIGDVGRNMAEHRHLLETLECRDAERARAAAERHVINAILDQDERRRQRERASEYSLRKALLD